MEILYVGFILLLLLAVLLPFILDDFQAEEVYVDINDYTMWLHCNYFTLFPPPHTIDDSGIDSFQSLLEDEYIFEKYLKEHNLPLNTELRGV